MESLDSNHEIKEKMTDNDEPEVISYTSQFNLPFIIIGIINNDDTRILLIDSNRTPYLGTINQLNDWNLVYGKINGDRTVVINRLDRIRHGYLNCNDDNLLTCDYEAGCIFTINHIGHIESQAIGDIKLSGSSYSLTTSNQLSSIIVDEGTILINTIEWLLVPINIRVKLPTKETITDYYPQLPPQYIEHKTNHRILSRWALILIAAIIIIALYVITNRHQFKPLTSKSV